MPSTYERPTYIAVQTRSGVRGALPDRSGLDELQYGLNERKAGDSRYGLMDPFRPAMCFVVITSPQVSDELTPDTIDLTSPPSQRKSTRAPRPLTPADSRAEDWSGSSGGSPEFISAGDPLDLTKTVEDVAHSSSRPTIVPLRPETVSLDLSSPVSVNGRSLWQGDVLACCCEMGPDATWEVEGYGGLIATVSSR